MDKKLVLSVSDSELVGKKFEEGNLQLDLSGDFFRGSKIPESDIAKLSESAAMITVIGKKSTEFFIKKGIVKRENVKSIAGIPHIQIFRL